MSKRPANRPRNIVKGAIVPAAGPAEIASEVWQTASAKLDGGAIFSTVSIELAFAIIQTLSGKLGLTTQHALGSRVRKAENPS